MKYGKFISALLFAGLLKVNAQDCNVVNEILQSSGIQASGDCCTYAQNDQYVVKCNGASVTSLSVINAQNVAEVPASVANLASLESIDFSNCNIAQFPYHLKTLPNLKSISLLNNGITEITDEIAEFKALENLDLGNNAIAALPASLGQLSKLNTLNLNNNNIQTLPDSLFQLGNLKKLNIASNPDLTASLKKFPAAVDQCNIKSTHICIEEKGVCNNYLVNNNRMPYCHPEQFTEEELNADNSGVQEEKSAQKGSSKVWIIILCIVLALLIIGAIAGYFIYKKRNAEAEASPAPAGNNEIEMQKN